MERESWALSGQLSAGGKLWGTGAARGSKRVGGAGQRGLVVQECLASLSKQQFLLWHDSPSPQQEMVAPRHWRPGMLGVCNRHSDGLFPV